MMRILKVITLGCLLALAGPAVAQEGESSAQLSDLFAPQMATAKRLDDKTVQLSYTYTAPNTCWTLGTAEKAAIVDTVLVALLTPQIEDKICAMTLTALDYQVTFEAPLMVETIFVQVMHPFGERIETSEILIE